LPEPSTAVLIGWLNCAALFVPSVLPMLLVKPATVPTCPDGVTSRMASL
jgi:hypothetical protein